MPSRKSKILVSSLLAWSVLTWCEKENQSPETTTQNIQATIVTQTTKNKIQCILQAENLCHQNEQIKITKISSNGSQNLIEFQCETKDPIAINGVTQFPKIPWIPTGTPIPSFYE